MEITDRIDLAVRELQKKLKEYQEKQWNKIDEILDMFEEDERRDLVILSLSTLLQDLQKSTNEAIDELYRIGK